MRYTDPSWCETRHEDFVLHLFKPASRFAVLAMSIRFDCCYVCPCATLWHYSSNMLDWRSGITLSQCCAYPTRTHMILLFRRLDVAAGVKQGEEILHHDSGATNLHLRCRFKAEDLRKVAAWLWRLALRGAALERREYQQVVQELARAGSSRGRGLFLRMGSLPKTQNCQLADCETQANQSAFVFCSERLIVHQTSCPRSPLASTIN